MRFLLLNQYGPPDASPTARLLGDLAAHLRGRGHEVEIVAQSRSYQGRPARGLERLRREGAGLVAILRAGWRKRNPSPDVVLALSSPPGLLAIAALLARRQSARLAHWAMDLYPELALALGEIGRGLVYRALSEAMRRAYRRCSLIVALDEDMQAHLQDTYGVRHVQVLEPWPSADCERQLASVGNAANAPAARWTWLYSGNLGRAHEWRTLIDAQRLLEDRKVPVTLIFQGDGSSRPAAAAYAASLNLQRCEWKGYAPQTELVDSLLTAHLLVATQRAETCGLLWPSKLAVMERLPRPVLFVGPTTGAIAERLRRRAQAGVFAPGQAEEVAAWVEARWRDEHAESGPPLPANSSTAVADGCRQLETWLLGLAEVS